MGLWVSRGGGGGFLIDQVGFLQWHLSSFGGNHRSVIIENMYSGIPLGSLRF